MEKAVVKYNSSLGAILCSNCRKIIKIGKEFTDEEWKYFRGELDYDLLPQYCDDCKFIQDDDPQTESSETI